VLGGTRSRARRSHGVQQVGYVVYAEEQDVVADGLGHAVGDPFDVQAQPDTAGAFAVGREVVFQCVVEAFRRGLGRGVVGQVGREELAGGGVAKLVAAYRDSSFGVG
jgi:hypothetical protein